MPEYQEQIEHESQHFRGAKINVMDYCGFEVSKEVAKWPKEKEKK